MASAKSEDNVQTFEDATKNRISRKVASDAAKDLDGIRAIMLDQNLDLNKRTFACVRSQGLSGIIEERDSAGKGGAIKQLTYWLSRHV